MNCADVGPADPGPADLPSQDNQESMQEAVQEAPKVSDEAVHEVPALTEESAKQALEAAAAAVTAPPVSTEQVHMTQSGVSEPVPVSETIPVSESAPVHEAVPVSEALVNTLPTTTTGLAVPGSVPLGTVPDVPLANAGMSNTLKDDDHANPATDEIPLVEVAEAMCAANDVFSRVKSEKIAEQALCSIRNDRAQYEGLAKEIVDKAIKQKERERANRASAAASRAKVLRYQTELESRLNRMEAERNAYRRELQELRCQNEGGRKILPDEVKQLHKLQDWIRKMELANPQFVRSIIAQGEIDKLLGEAGITEDKMELEEEKDQENSAKRRRL